MNINERSTCIKRSHMQKDGRQTGENGLHVDRVEHISTPSTTCIRRWIQSDTSCIRSTCRPLAFTQDTTTDRTCIALYRSTYIVQCVNTALNWHPAFFNNGILL